jgi:hypothetical protein
MKSRCTSVLFAATILLAGAAHAAIDAQNTVRLDRAAMVGRTILPAGTYRVYLAAGRDVAKFMLGKRTVAEAPCKVELAEVVYPGNAAHIRTGDDGRDRLIKIVFLSSKLAVEFPAEQAVAAEAPASKETGGR